MSNWIDHQAPEMTRRWLRETSVPLLVTLESGTVLWCNEAFEHFLGYTVSELRGLGEDAWLRLTADQSEATYDQEMAAMVRNRERYDYRYRKKCISKDGVPKACEIHVLRHPETDDFQYFLVSVIPLDLSYGAMVEELQLLQKAVLDMTARPDMWDRIQGFYKTNPKTAIVIAVVLAYLLFGDRVTELVGRAMQLFNGGGQGG